MTDSGPEGFAPEARQLIAAHQRRLESTPPSFRPLVVRQLRAWEGLFPPERESLAGLLQALDGLDEEKLSALFQRIDAIPLPAVSDLHPLFDEEKLLDRCLRHFRSQGTYQSWRLAVDDAFQKLTSAAGPERSQHLRLVVVMLGEGTGAGQTIDDPDQRYLSYFWNHLQPLGTLFGQVSEDRTGMSELFEVFRGPLARPQIRVWAIETGTALRPPSGPSPAPTWLSFEHLRPVMDRVTRKMADTMLAGVGGPEALYAKVTDFKVEELGLPDYEDVRIRKFIEQLILQGSGALVINNTFAEWAAMQALRRVEPDLLVVRFGQRRRFVPLRHLDPFQTAKSAAGELAAEDAGDSLQDGDVFTYYLWLETRKNPKYRETAYFLVCLEGSGAALLMGPSIRRGHRISERIGTGDLVATISHLFGAGTRNGRVLNEALISPS